jgi:hypothetical protein
MWGGASKEGRVPQLTKEQLYAFARLGAEARLAQIDAEIAAIKSAYPDLGVGSRRARTGGAAPPQSAPRKPYRMSPQARQAAAERMRKYWAERRSASQQPAPVAQASEAPKRKRRAARSARTRGGKKR